MKNTAEDMGMRIPDGYEIDWTAMRGQGVRKLVGTRREWYRMTGHAMGGGIIDRAYAVALWDDRRGNYCIELGAAVDNA